MLGVRSSKLTVSRPLNEKYLAEWLLDHQDEPLWDTAILRAILEIQKSLLKPCRQQRPRPEWICAVAKRR
jgi:hypothetical protein